MWFGHFNWTACYIASPFSKVFIIKVTSIYIVCDPVTPWTWTYLLKHARVLDQLICVSIITTPWCISLCNTSAVLYNNYYLCNTSALLRYNYYYPCNTSVLLYHYYYPCNTSAGQRYCIITIIRVLRHIVNTSVNVGAIFRVSINGIAAMQYSCITVTRALAHLNSAVVDFV